MFEVKVVLKVPDDATMDEVLAVVRHGLDRVYDVEDSEYARMRFVAGNTEVVGVTYGTA